MRRDIRTIISLDNFLQGESQTSQTRNYQLWSLKMSRVLTNMKIRINLLNFNNICLSLRLSLNIETMVIESPIHNKDW